MNVKSKIIKELEVNSFCKVLKVHSPRKETYDKYAALVRYPSGYITLLIITQIEPVFTFRPYDKYCVSRDINKLKERIKWIKDYCEYQLDDLMFIRYLYPDYRLSEVEEESRKQLMTILYFITYPDGEDYIHQDYIDWSKPKK